MHQQQLQRMHEAKDKPTSKPGSYALMPSCKAFSMSIVPHIRSSVAPRGSSTCSHVFSQLYIQ